ncbi:cytokine-like nuclear factor N-PAC [Chironomus tepperi]|uniref:cytokine-like nuclear factor N-PAC n=1 Tax=Chironomus tepperi TaxID=113505 RepID=UPI00391F31BD
MGKKTGVFTEGQLVYAKVKGYAPWPAKITKVIAKHKYGVYFYGTGETGNCKSEELDPYDDKNRARFNTERQMKKPDYKEAVDQIELAATGNDPAPIIPADDSIKQTSHEDEAIEKTEDISQTDDFDPEESHLQIAEEVPKSTPVQKKKPVSKPKAVSTPIVKLESETKENDEKVSRSGRKIKEKKINNDEMDPDEVFTIPRKRLKVEESRTNQKPVQELNDSTINDFCISKMHILQDPVRKQFLTTQFDMIKTVQEIKQALGLDEVDMDRALDSCKTLKEKVVPSITQFMLLKYSNTVVTIKRLRNYIGNVMSWGLEEKQLIEFQEKAKEIRDIASEIYFSLKKLFPEAPEDSSFWQFYTDQHKQFQEKYSKLDVTDLFEAFNEEELELFLNKSTNNHDAEVPQLPEDDAQMDEEANEAEEPEDDPQ